MHCWDQPSDRPLIHRTQAYLRLRAQCLDTDEFLEASWLRFYRTYRPLVRLVAQQFDIPAADFEDAIQEVWRRICQRLPAFQYDPSRGRFRAWLWTLSAHVLAEFRRRRNSPWETPLPDDAAWKFWSPDPDPQALYDLQEFQAEIRALLLRLRPRISPRSYQVLCFRLVDGRSVRETAALLMLSPQQVCSTYHRALKKFLGLVPSRQADC